MSVTHKAALDLPPRARGLGVRVQDFGSGVGSQRL